MCVCGGRNGAGVYGIMYLTHQHSIRSLLKHDEKHISFSELSPSSLDFQQTRHVLLVSGRMRLVVPCLVLKIPMSRISIITVHCAKTHLTDHPVRLCVRINIFPMYPKRYVRLESGMRSNVRFPRPRVAVLASSLEWLVVLVFCCCFFVACFYSFSFEKDASHMPIPTRWGLSSFPFKLRRRFRFKTCVYFFLFMYMTK